MLVIVWVMSNIRIFIVVIGMLIIGFIDIDYLGNFIVFMIKFMMNVEIVGIVEIFLIVMKFATFLLFCFL